MLIIDFIKTLFEEAYNDIKFIIDLFRRDY